MIVFHSVEITLPSHFSLAERERVRESQARVLLASQMAVSFSSLSTA